MHLDDQVSTLNRLHAFGWSLIPAHGVMADWPAPDRQACGCPDPACTRPGKHPAVKWKGLPRLGWGDLMRFRDQYRAAHDGNGPNWAAKLGQSRLCVIDVDDHVGGAAGSVEFARLLAAHGPLPATAADTRGHHYFRTTGPWPKAKYLLAPGVELLGHSATAEALTYCPPSGHPSGPLYRFLPGLAPWECGVADLPAWVEELRASLDPPAPAPVPVSAAKLREHGRAAAFGRLRAGSGRQSVADRARAWLAAVGPAVQGCRGDEHTYGAAHGLVRGFGLSEGEALALLGEWNQTCSPPWSDGELAAKVRSAAGSPIPVGYLRDADRAATPPTRKRVRIRLVLRDGRAVPSVAAAPGAAAEATAAAVAGAACGCRRADCGGRFCDDPGARPAPFADLSGPAWERLGREAARDRARRVRDGELRAARAAADRRNLATCPHEQRVVTRGVDRRGHQRLMVARTNCMCWRCRVCVGLLAHQWGANFRLRLNDLPQCHAAEGVGDGWRQAVAAVRAAGGSYFRAVGAAGRWLVVASVATPGARAETPGDAAAALDGELARAVLAGGTPKVSSSRDWALPKLPKGGGEVVGVVPDDMDDEDMIRAVEACGAAVEGVEVPAAYAGRVVTLQAVPIPAGWTAGMERRLIAAITGGAGSAAAHRPNRGIAARTIRVVSGGRVVSQSAGRPDVA